MSKREWLFDQRQAKCQEALSWMRATADRALNEGTRECSVSCRDMLDVCAHLESMMSREKIEFAGKRVGYCRPEDIRKLLSNTNKFISIRSYKGLNYNIEVSYVAELPPLVVPDEDGIPMDTVQNASLAQAES